MYQAPPFSADLQNTPGAPKPGVLYILYIQIKITIVMRCTLPFSIGWLSMMGSLPDQLGGWKLFGCLVTVCITRHFSLVLFTPVVNIWASPYSDNVAETNSLVCVNAIFVSRCSLHLFVCYWCVMLCTGMSFCSMLCSVVSDRLYFYARLPDNCQLVYRLIPSKRGAQETQMEGGGRRALPFT